MRKVTVSAKTVDDAISKALQQLQTTKDRVEIQIIEEPAKGFLGLIGGKPAVVEVTEISGTAEQIADNVANTATQKSTSTVDPIEEGKKFVTAVMEQMGVFGHIEVFHREEGVTFNLMGKGIGLLIGHHGQTLDALQYLVNTVVNRHTEAYIRVQLDAENYRDKRKATLEELADRLARKAARTRQAVKLEPMSALERKIIHTKLQDDPYVETYSEGVEPRRYIVIVSKRK